MNSKRVTTQADPVGAQDGMTLNYGEGWPNVQNLAAQVEFRNEGMSGHFLSGRIGDIPVGAADARFPDFKTGELEIHVSAAGDAADALAFLRATPLDATRQRRGRNGLCDRELDREAAQPEV